MPLPDRRAVNADCYMHHSLCPYQTGVRSTLTVTCTTVCLKLSRPQASCFTARSDVFVDSGCTTSTQVRTHYTAATTDFLAINSCSFTYLILRIFLVRLVPILTHQKALNPVWIAEIAVREFTSAVDTIPKTTLVAVWNKWFERMAKCVATHEDFT